MDDELPHIERATTSGILDFLVKVQALMKAERAELCDYSALPQKCSTVEPSATPPVQAQ